MQMRAQPGTGFRGWLVAALMLAAFGSSPSTAFAADARVHALSLIDKVQYGPDFKHFDWVNPDAPKGGVVRLYAPGTYDSLNGFSVKGNPAVGTSTLIYDQLMVSSPDEPSAEYCLVCEWVSHPADFSSVTFGLRKEAKFHDGRPITPEDVIFSMEALKKANPRTGGYYINVVKGEKTGEREVTFTFDSKGNRELPLIVGGLHIIPNTVPA
jgi:microcin C transport system substrate-binding protein